MPVRFVARPLSCTGARARCNPATGSRPVEVRAGSGREAVHAAPSCGSRAGPTPNPGAADVPPYRRRVRASPRCSWWCRRGRGGHGRADGRDVLPGAPPSGTAAQAQASHTADAGADRADHRTPTASPSPPPARRPQVVALIAAGNQIARLPYQYGGGHGSFDDTAYDCSGSVSFALHGAGLLDATLDSTGLGRWGVAGAGRWITVYANKTHTYLVVAGLRFDTQRRHEGAARAGRPPRGRPRASRSATRPACSA